MVEDPKKEQGSNEPVLPEPIAGFEDFGAMGLKSVCNARDLGGMPAADGMRIKKGRLLRSGELHGLDPADSMTLIKDHNLARIYDLRTGSEIRIAPDSMEMLTGVNYISMPAIPESEIAVASLNNAFEDAKILQRFLKDPFKVIEGLYHSCVTAKEGQMTYAAFLDELLLHDEDATLWHCTQGKDRTGIAAVLVEYALGVSMDDIWSDYLATNLFMTGWIERFSHLFDNVQWAQGLDDSIDAYSYADPSYLQGALDCITDIAGNLDGYLANVLDFGPKKQERLRELYLE